MFVQNNQLILSDVNETPIGWIMHCFVTLLQGCQPYLLKPLKKTDIKKCSTQCLQTPSCVKNKCTNPYYRVTGDKPTYFKGTTAIKVIHEDYVVYIIFRNHFIHDYFLT